MHHHAKFSQIRSNICGDMAIFRFLQDGDHLPSIMWGAFWTTR